MRKITYDMIQRYSIIILVSVTSALIMLILFSAVMITTPKFKENGWDLLAFTGSIIGGLITYIGVNLTITAQRNDRKLEKYYEDKAVMYKIIQDTHFIKNVGMIQISSKDSDGHDQLDTYNTLKIQLKSIIDFITIMESQISQLIKSIDEEVFEIIHIRMKLLSGTMHYNKHFDFYYSARGENRTKDTIEGYLDDAVKIQTLLCDYQEERTKEYKETKRKIKK